MRKCGKVSSAPSAPAAQLLLIGQHVHLSCAHFWSVDGVALAVLVDGLPCWKGM